jgi:hypothetical protein
VMLYFAYGSNLDWAQMKQRCPLAKFVCRAKLPAHRLAFTLKSPRRDCGVADVLPDQAKDVWGVVYELLADELKDLDKDEDFSPARPNDQNEYTREDHYVWQEATRTSSFWLYFIGAIRGSTRLCPVTITKS